MNAKTFVLPVAAMLLLAPDASADFGQCERLQYSFEPLRQAENLTIQRSSRGIVAADALWDAAAISLYGLGSASWNSIRPATSPAITFNLFGATSTAGYSGISDAEIVQRYSGFGSLGTASTYHVWPGWDIQHTDLRILGPTVSAPACGGTCPPLGPTATCALGVATEGGTVVHELGHAYGFDHQDDVMSMMASSQADILGCALGSGTPGVSTALIPDANGQMCMRNAYDLNPGRDLGITAMSNPAGCNARAGFCYAPFVPAGGALIDFDAASPPTVPLVFTVFNNGDTIPGSVNVRAVLSLDTSIDPTDIEFFSSTVSGTGIAGGFDIGDTVIVRTSAELTAPVPIGPTYRVLVEIDSPGVFSTLGERDETNNVTDLRVVVRRST